MREVSSRRVISVLSGVLYFLLAATVLADDPHPLDMTKDVIWTSVPVRIDRSRQHYERIPTPPDPFPFKPRLKGEFEVQDGRSFSSDGNVYLLSVLGGLSRQQICTDEAGLRTACGQFATAVLRDALIKGYLECQIKPIALGTFLADCRTKQAYATARAAQNIALILKGQSSAIRR